MPKYNAFLSDGKTLLNVSVEDKYLAEEKALEYTAILLASVLREIEQIKVRELTQEEIDIEEAFIRKFITALGFDPK